MKEGADERGFAVGQEYLVQGVYCVVTSTTDSRVLSSQVTIEPVDKRVEQDVVDWNGELGITALCPGVKQSA